MSNPEYLIIAGYCLATLVAGTLLGWLLSQSRALKEKTATLSDLAVFTEKASTLKAMLDQEIQENTENKLLLDQYKAAYDAISNDVATLNERASQLGELHKTTNAELGSVRMELQRQIAFYNETIEAKAALQNQVLHIPRLEERLATATQAQETTRQQLGQLTATNRADVSRLSAELAAEREALEIARNERERLKLELIEAKRAKDSLSSDFTELKTRAENERTHAEEKQQMLLEAKESLTAQFKALAQDILDDKAKKFSELNQDSLGQLLNPLKTQLSEFKGKVEEVYVQEGKDRSALAEQVRQLATLNRVLSEDAKNLTEALKGQAKTQGNWGELILERVLEASGLRKGFEYQVQDHQVREDGSRAQPDVVIDLPDDRKLVVDAKVSLVAYERYVSAASDEERSAALKQHLLSLREHIRGLSDKNYHQLYGIQSPDFVLAFIPIEPAFIVAVTADNDLFMHAWERNVLLVSPSTLLFVVRTVAHLWRQEAQSRNAQEIAKRGSLLYDKLVGFAEDLERVGKSLGQCKTAYDQAYGKLVGGRGNLISQAETLRKLGVTPTKSLPKPLVEIALDSEEKEKMMALG